VENIEQKLKVRVVYKLGKPRHKRKRSKRNVYVHPGWNYKLLRSILGTKIGRRPNGIHIISATVV